MKRDMIAIAEATREKIPDPYDLTIGELQTLYAMSQAGKLFEAYGTAFRYGYAMALRATKRQNAAARTTRRKKATSPQTESAP